MQNYKISPNRKGENIGGLWFIDHLDTTQKYDP